MQDQGAVTSQFLVKRLSPACRWLPSRPVDGGLLAVSSHSRGGGVVGKS